MVRVTRATGVPPEAMPASDAEKSGGLAAIIEAITAETELRPLLTRLLGEACKAIGADTGILGLYDPDRDLVRMEAVHAWRKEDVGLELKRGVGMSGRVLETRQPFTLHRYDQLQIMAAPELADRPVIGAPIFWKDDLLGTIGAAGTAPKRFDQSDIDTLVLYARAMAIGIRHVWHHELEEKRQNRTALMSRISRSFAAGVDLHALCENAVRVIHELMGYPNVGLGLIDAADPDTIVGRYHGGAFRHLVQGEQRFHVSQGVIGAAVRERRLQRVVDVEKDARFIPTPGLDGIRSEIAIPLLYGPVPIGVLNVESPCVLTEDDAANLQMVADHLAGAISNSRRFQDAQRVAVLEERHRLARDLHDSITQMVFSASLIAQSLPGSWKRDPAEGERLAERVVGVTRSALTELRALLHELRPTGSVPVEPAAGPSEMERLRRDGLASLVRSESTRVTGGALVVELDLARYETQSFEREEALYRVFQEALYNVTKHARANWVRVRLESVDGRVVLHVSDDGVGFDLDAPKVRPQGRPPGLGRGMMAERVQQMGGVLRTRSRPGEGTTVEVSLPVAEETE
jgi:signal transduction histidine kinase